MKPIRTLAMICLAAGIGDEHTLLDLIERPFDPIPVRYARGRRAWIFAERLAMWRRREAKDPTLPRVEGQRAIAKAVGCALAAAPRLARRSWHPLPVFFRDDGTAWAYESALLDWIDAEDQPGWRVRMGEAVPKAEMRAKRAEKAAA